MHVHLKIFYTEFLGSIVCARTHMSAPLMSRLWRAFNNSARIVSKTCCDAVVQCVCMRQNANLDASDCNCLYLAWS